MTTTAALPSDDAVAVPLDSLLSNVGRSATGRLLPGQALLTWAAALARNPGRVSERLVHLVAELARVGAGISEAAPSKRDRRFADPAWSGNPVLRRSVQTYLAISETVLQLVADAGLDERTERKLTLLIENFLDAIAPSNSPFLNPAAMKEAIDTGGANFVRGLRHLVTDLASRPRVPAMVDDAAFEVGGNLATSEGAVVHRTPVFELIQYTPTTKKVRAVPLVMVPPTINKYYVLDLAPGRSTVEHLVNNGHQVFVLSWRNPGARHASWGIDTYIHAALEAVEAAREITQSETAHLYGACSGGIIASMAAAHLAGTARGDLLASLTLAVTVLDQSNAGTANAIVNPKRANAAIALSKRVGYLDGRALAEVFAWLRPNDLIWNYWVNNYLLGRKPPAFDILSWNADTTRMTAKLHEDFLRMSLANKLVHAGEATAMGVPVDLQKVVTDTYVIGGETDHITPWQSCYRSTALLGGKTEFVLSTSGHIAALVNPPSASSKSTFRHSVHTPSNTAEYLATADVHEGSWWNHYSDWLAARGGDEVAAPAGLGRGRYRPIAVAPGTYVHDK